MTSILSSCRYNISTYEIIVPKQTDYRMCGRYAMSYEYDDLVLALEESHLSVNKNEPEQTDTTYNGSYNIAPTKYAPVYYNNSSDPKGENRDSNSIDCAYSLKYMRWGFIPHWAKKTDMKNYNTFNARNDSLLKSNLWKSAVGSKRCVIPIQGYYEWRKSSSKEKNAFYVTRKDGELMFLAGLYDYDKKDSIYTFTIITGDAPDELKWLHHRMPTVVEPDSETWNLWLNTKKTDWTDPELMNLTMPWFDDVTYAAYQVNNAVGKVSNDGDYLVKPIFKKDINLLKREQKVKEEEEDAGSYKQGKNFIEGSSEEDKPKLNKKDESTEDSSEKKGSSNKRDIKSMLRERPKKRVKSD